MDIDTYSYFLSPNGINQSENIEVKITLPLPDKTRDVEPF